MSKVVVVDYDPAWPEIFEQIRARVWPAVADLATTIEHIGSTSVPGLAAKPVIDLDLVVPAASDIPTVIDRLATIGYEHRGDLGIPGRESFRAPADLPRHHLYACPGDNHALANHLAVRNHLRADPETARAYGELKRELARRFPDDIDSYVDGKTDMILEILRMAEFEPELLEMIERINRKRE
jgi:GrpB-like predicted nucleotidyltransferase (UPF0157 family)